MAGVAAVAALPVEDPSGGETKLAVGVGILTGWLRHHARLGRVLPGPLRLAAHGCGGADLVGKCVNA